MLRRRGHRVNGGESLDQRIQAHLERMAHKRGFKTNLAKRMDLSPQAITKYIAGERRLTIEMLEAMSEVSGTPVAEIVVPAGSETKQLDAGEAALVRHLRRWPTSVRDALVSFVAFFADEPPAGEQARNLHEIYRQADQKQRDLMHACAVLIARNAPPELVAELFRGLSKPSKAALGKRGNEKT